MKTLPKVIGLLVHVHYVFLQDNELTDLPEELGNLEIKYLGLSQNKFKSLPPWISSFEMLEDLKVDHNALEDVSIEFEKLTKLKSLALDHNKLTCLPKGLGKLQALQSLNLSYNKKLSSLPHEIGDLPGIVELDTSGTKISKENLKQVLLKGKELRSKVSEIELVAYLLNPNLAGRTSLVQRGLLGEDPKRAELINGLNKWVKKEFVEDKRKGIEVGCKILMAYDERTHSLSLSLLKLKTLLPEIGLLEELSYLYISGNQLKDLPEEIGNLTKLRLLDVSRNQLRELPRSIERLTALKYLYVSHNNLSLLSADVGELKALESLELHNNPNLTLLFHQLEKIPGIIDLNISGTRLSKTDVHQLLLKCQESRTKTASTQLPAKLNELAKEAKEAEITDLSNLSSKQVEDLHEWIIRLRLNITEGAKKVVYKMIQTLLTDESFKKRFFAHITPRLDPSAGKTTSTLSALFPLWLLSNLPEDAQERLKSMERIAKTYTLHCYLQELFNAQIAKGESVFLDEATYTLYARDLKELLGLCPSFIYEPYSLEHGAKKWIDQEDLIKHVKENWQKTLNSFELY